MVNTPLRYPGGKSVMTNFFIDFIRLNQMENVIYAEPYAGGAGAGINLLLAGCVKTVYINDASKAIYAFWISLIENSEAFLKLFDAVDVSLSEWYKQKSIFQSSDSVQINDMSEMLKLGFATFYLNRTNRSGVLNAGPVGGSSSEAQEQANYKIDARFQKERLRSKLLKIIAYKKNIKVFNDDALFFLKNRIKSSKTSERQRNILVYLDPPYYVQGSNLYMNYYKEEDHQKLAKYLKRSSFFKWVLSYDDVEEIRNMYYGFNQYTFKLSYSVESKRKGSELLIHSTNSIISKVIQKKNSRRMEIELDAKQVGV
ncbi:MAG: DNA adenine methylase [Labilibaculum sp.]|nr:DNA adenine methylase [Labilibaculum sp.]